MKLNLILAVILLITGTALCDVYMHNPRGSNNRNCERNDNRQNANRLFDSQNNAAGGYACPRAVGGPETVTKTMYYYVGSELDVEWTNQHSCGNPNNHCEVIVQYMCNDVSPGLRDGTPLNSQDPATTRISVATKDNPNFGSHEEYSWYQKCQTRKRNVNLFTADQITSQQRSTATRQENNANNRYGWECPEERDYYPYWAPTPWKDIAVLTNNITRCEYYKKESQNVIGRGECLGANDVFLEHNNENECILAGAKWNVSGAWGLPAPECLPAPFSRDNHLGNSKDGDASRYKWKIPDEPGKKCVLRLRYNITTGDMHWDYNKKLNKMIVQDKIIDSKSYGYQHSLELAQNTDQYGRTFQDRSYVFEIKERPEEVSKDVKIWNLNVRGKRGNIVDTFPSVEYDFIPTVLSVKGGEYVHIQWTGSDYNPNRNPNNAEGGPVDKANPGNYRADRNNLVQMNDVSLNEPRPLSQVTMFYTPKGKPDEALINRLALIDQDGLTSTNAQIKCLNKTELLAKNNGNVQNAQRDIQNCMKLNSAPTPYFDAGLVKMRVSGRFAYQCTRNNNFSNRSQKGILIVEGGEFNAASVKVLSFTTLILSVLVFFLF